LCCKIEIECRCRSQLFVLNYQNITRLEIDVKSVEHVQFSLESENGLGSWLVDEISLVNKNLFRHEIILDTKNSILCAIYQIKYHTI